MLITWLLSFMIGACFVGLVATTRTRGAELARLANTMCCTFDKHKETITTQLTAGRLEFFTLFFHQYRNVFTGSDNVSFIRMADDTIYLDENPKTKPIHLTIFTAELKKRQFPLLKAAPLKSPFAPSQHALMKTNIPTIDRQYRIHAPTAASGVLFTPLITGLLKTRPNIYLELNDNALVYHEHTLVPVEEMEAFRFRALQILGELEKLIEQLDKNHPETSTPPTLTDAAADVRAAAILQHFGTPEAVSTSAKQSWRGFWFLMLIVMFLAVTFLSWFALRNWLPQ